MAKAWQIIKKVFSIVIVVVSVAIMLFTVISVTMFDRNDRNVFGFKAFIVLSDSMSATDFSAGDVVIVKSVDPYTLEEGDIISYTSQNPDNYMETVTHKIRCKTTNAAGENGFITYGTTTGVDDETVVTFPFISGKYIFHLPKVGTFFNFLKTTPGYIVCILIPFLLLIIMQGINTVKLFKQYKKEQLDVLQEERAKLEEERRQSEEMMAELLKLKQQLAEKDGDKPTEAAEAEKPAEAAPASKETAPAESASNTGNTDN